MQPAHICIVSQLHPSTNPRVVKEARALARAGYRVSVVCCVHSAELLTQDQLLLGGSSIELIPAVNLIHGATASARRFFVRLIRRLAVEATRLVHWETIHATCHSPRSLLTEAERTNADLYIGHIDGGIWVGLSLLHKGLRVAFDFEDWHSRDGLPDARKRYPWQFMERVEEEALRKGEFTTTTSEAMADALQNHFKCKRPRVIYNAFPWCERDLMDGKHLDRRDRKKHSFHWFSQTIGPGRGLEEMVEALHRVKRPVQVHLRGASKSTFCNLLQIGFPRHLGHELLIHERIPHAQMLSRIAEHDFGLALERLNPPNKNLTVSNKVFQYLLAGIPMIATATAGQREIADDAGAVITLAEPADPDSLADAINRVTTDEYPIETLKSEARRLAKSRYCWEQQEGQFLSLVSQALGQ